MRGDSPQRPTCEWSIWRILGNETPPRDTPGQRLKVLRYILQTEEPFPDMEKWYIVNRVHDEQFRRELCLTLEEFNTNYVVIPPSADRVRRAVGRQNKILQAIGVNAARNLAVNLGGSISKFAVVLDGDCFFTRKAWTGVVRGVVQDHMKQREYYSIPIVRTVKAPCDNFSESFSEPQLVFRSGASLRFNERQPFGDADKLELLFRLGHDQRTGHHCEIHGTVCKSVGYVFHMATGDEKLERIPAKRHAARAQSITQLLELAVK